MGFYSYVVYSTVQNSVRESSDLHLSMAVFCKISYYRSRESEEVREEVDRAGVVIKLLGCVALLSLRPAFTVAIGAYISVAKMEEMF